MLLMWRNHFVQIKLLPKLWPTIGIKNRITAQTVANDWNQEMKFEIKGSNYCSALCPYLEINMNIMHTVEDLVSKKVF